MEAFKKVDVLRKLVEIFQQAKPKRTYFRGIIALEATM
jgi:hypothetical protein